MSNFFTPKSKSYRDAGVNGWLVRCPKRGDMAAMRCAEYQRRDGCGVSCRSKAGEGTVAALSAMRNSILSLTPAIEGTSAAVPPATFNASDSD